MPKAPGPRQTRRKHRRVRKDWKGCRCPEGAKKVSTCSVTPTGEKVCRGRGWGCIGERVSKKGKRYPGFVAAICDPRILT